MDDDDDDVDDDVRSFLIESLGDEDDDDDDARNFLSDSGDVDDERIFLRDSVDDIVGCLNGIFDPDDVDEVDLVDDDRVKGFVTIGFV